MVRGTVTNSTGNETGVTVNGIVAVVYNGEFFVNHVPLQDGQTTITANAVDTAGNAASHSILVTADTSQPHVTLRANIESGIAPLTSYFSVSTSIPNSVANYAFDYEGDGTDDYTGTTFEDISVTYNGEGVAYPTIIVTDDQGMNYTDTIAIVVLNQNDLDALLQAKWEGMKTALMAGDVTTALSYFVEESRNRYDAIFSQMNSAEIDAVFSSINELRVYSIKGRAAQCGAIRIESGGTFSYPVTFVKDENGIWKLMGF